MEQKWVCKMPQNLGVENAPTTSLARPQSPSTGLEAEEQEGSLLWPHTSGSSHGQTLPVPWPGDKLPVPCPALCAAPLGSSHTSLGHSQQQSPRTTASGPSLLAAGCFFQAPALLGGEPRPAGAGSRSSLCRAVPVPLLPVGSAVTCVALPFLLQWESGLSCIMKLNLAR